MQKIWMDLWALLQPIFLALSMFAAAWISAKLSRYLDQKNAEKFQDQLREAMRDATSFVFQQKVKSLKDPSKPGVFDQEAQKAAAKQAIHLVLSTHGEAVEKVRSYGIDPEKFLEQLVERAVVELDTRVESRLQVSPNAVTINGSQATTEAPKEEPVPTVEIQDPAPAAEPAPTAEPPAAEPAPATDPATDHATKENGGTK